MILDERGKEREKENEHMAINKSKSNRRPFVRQTVKKRACIDPGMTVNVSIVPEGCLSQLWNALWVHARWAGLLSACAICKDGGKPIILIVHLCVNSGRLVNGWEEQDMSKDPEVVDCASILYRSARKVVD